MPLENSMQAHGNEEDASPLHHTLPRLYSGLVTDYQHLVHAHTLSHKHTQPPCCINVTGSCHHAVPSLGAWSWYGAGFWRMCSLLLKRGWFCPAGGVGRTRK